MIRLVVDGEAHEIDVEPHHALLWVLRHRLKVRGLRSRCEVGACGTCTVLLDDRPVQACVTPVSDADGGTITTRR